MSKHEKSGSLPGLVPDGVSAERVGKASSCRGGGIVVVRTASEAWLIDRAARSIWQPGTRATAYRPATTRDPEVGEEWMWTRQGPTDTDPWGETCTEAGVVHSVTVVSL